MNPLQKKKVTIFFACFYGNAILVVRKLNEQLKMQSKSFPMTAAENTESACGQSLSL